MHTCCHGGTRAKGTSCTEYKGTAMTKLCRKPKKTSMRHQLTQTIESNFLWHLDGMHKQIVPWWIGSSTALVWLAPMCLPAAHVLHAKVAVCLFWHSLKPQDGSQDACTVALVQERQCKDAPVSCRPMHVSCVGLSATGKFGIGSAYLLGAGKGRIGSGCRRCLVVVDSGR